MLEPGNNKALKIETARRQTGLIRQYPDMGPVEILAYMASEAVQMVRQRNICGTARRVHKKGPSLALVNPSNLLALLTSSFA